MFKVLAGIFLTLSPAIANIDFATVVGTALFAFGIDEIISKKK